MGSIMKLPTIVLKLSFGIFPLLGQVEDAENTKPQVQISSRFIDGDDVLSAPRVLTTAGQEAVMTVAQEVGDSLDGVVLSVTPRVVDGKIFLEGFAFAGKGKLDGPDGIKARAKLALESLKKKGADMEKIEMRGLFSIGGQPWVSLSVAGGSTFFFATRADPTRPKTSPSRGRQRPLRNP